MNTKLPVIAIVGRQNVGKSTLFNSIIREKKAIVDSHPGLTRDILSYTVNFHDKHFTITDTPGLDLESSSELSGPILDNARAHLEKASIIVFLMEYPAPAPFDMEILRIIRKLNKPSIIAVNKMDSAERMQEMSNFYETGVVDIVPVSALRRSNIDMLLRRITDLLPSGGKAVSEPDVTIAIAGRPNAGKSTLMNAFLGYERAIVSDIPGTTRDSVDDYFRYNGRLFRAVDTAGIRKKSKSAESVEFYSFRRSLDSISKSDVVLFLIDASQGLTEADKKIFDEIVKAGKPAVIAINKWDTVEKDDKTFNSYKDKLVFKLYRADDFPILSISARDRQRTAKLLELALDLKERASKRVETPLLNRTIAKLLNSGRVRQLGGTLKIYYAAQISTSPPEFKFFVNNPLLFKRDVVRFFEKSLQKEFSLHGLPVSIQISGKKRRMGGQE